MAAPIGNARFPPVAADAISIQARPPSTLNRRSRPRWWSRYTAGEASGGREYALHRGHEVLWRM
jgi:hypothetical protein